MKKVKIFVSYFIVLIFFSSIGAMCPQDNEEFIKALYDLKAEVDALQKQYAEKEDLRAKIQKEISIKEEKIKSLKRDAEEVKRRCP